MSQEEWGSLSERAGQEVGALLTRLSDQVELTDEQRQAVTGVLAEAVIAGIRLGAAEVAAKAIAEGADARLTVRLPSDHDDDED